MKTTVFCLALTLAVAATVPAYSADHLDMTQVPSTQAEKRVERAKTAIEKRGTGTASRVTVVLRDGSNVKGHITRIGDSSCDLTNEKTGQVSTISYDAIDRVKGPGMSRGKKIALWTGLGAGVPVVVILLIGWSWHGA